MKYTYKTVTDFFIIKPLCQSKEVSSHDEKYAYRLHVKCHAGSRKTRCLSHKWRSHILMNTVGHTTWTMQISVCSSLLLNDRAKCYHYIALPLDNWMNEYGALVEWDWWGQTKVLRQNPVPLSLCPSQITYGLAWDQTRVFMVCGQQLIAWAMVLPMYDQFWPFTQAVCVLQQNTRPNCSKQLHHKIHRMSATVAAVSHNYSLSSSTLYVPKRAENCLFFLLPFSYVVRNYILG